MLAPATSDRPKMIQCIMLRQRPSRPRADPVWTGHIEVPLAPVIQAPRSQASILEGRGRATILIGFSLALHVALGMVAVFVIRPTRPTKEEMPPEVELVFEAPSSPSSVPTPKDPGERPAEPAQAEHPAAPDAVPAPARQALEAPSNATVPPPDQPELPLPTPVPASEPEPSDPTQAALVPPAQPQPLPPVPATVAPRPPEPARRRPARPLPVPRAVPRDPSPSVVVPNTFEAPRPTASPSTRNSPLPFAAPSPSPMPAPPAASPASPSGAWRGALAAWVQSRKRYPDEARRRSAQGTVGVRFTVARDGQVLDAQVVQSSGSYLLDEAALTMFRGARTPQFTADMAQQQVSITVGIRYRLEE